MAQKLIKEHQFIKIKIKDLVFDPSNPNVMTDKQMHGLRASMNKYGNLVPVVVDLNNKIADGEHRAIIYREMGYEEIPAIKMKLDTEADRRTLRQVLNKLHGTHDKEKDTDELLHIFESEKLDELALMIAQPKDQLMQILQQYHPEYDFLKPEDSIFEEDISDVGPPSTQLGDLYLLGNRHRLICADSTDSRSIINKLLKPDDKVKHVPDLVFTDPPYNIGFHYNDNEDKLSISEYIDFCKNWYRVLKQSGSTKIIITPGPRNIVFWNEITEGELPTDVGTWYKANSRVQGRLFRKILYEPILFYGEGFSKDTKRPTDYFDFSSIISQNLRTVEHSTLEQTKTKGKGKRFDKYNPTDRVQTAAPAKPLKLINELIRQFSEPHSSVLDIFTGTGTTLISCEQTDRTFYGSEIDPRYCDVIVKRYEKYTGKEAIKL